ncbi:uncharacterized protein LOC115546731 [Gadus morhua]|uniref:uncharacterized protein LOC115546597 n=1 Tax=Gadus morhua TaxID=8049 RepID=UPI0011B5A8C6|nr:uncharacterized protein LOC115546597 [Gadus morhua]XP_030216066.1 uncharacterized protein LOC115546598 [Gadus morhua]XP_030216298.1 uncharacterized protein LOC115546731 [Gadus morhua]
MWGPRPTCCQKHLTKCGMYKTIRKVLDIDGWYLMATEYLECRRCRRKVAAWSQEVVRQLGEGHRALFPAILTYKLACDRRVIIQLRERTRGNSATQLQKKLCEAHTEAWMRRSIHYLSVMEPFTSTGVVRQCTPPPKPSPDVPQYGWLLVVYCHDILSRLEDVKARVTSVFGSILKMDSTKKVTRKLAGAAAHTAAWATNVGNEHGQVLMSVLTATEGGGLLPMAAGLMRRYRDAGVAQPRVLYVDRDCCSSHGGSKAAAAFQEWDKLVVRLDIWHLMRRYASGVTTESHQLYKPFLQQLSASIFLWDPEDTARLLNAKRRTLEAQGMTFSSEAGVWRHVSRREMALHCRRRTRGAAATERLIDDLLQTFGGANGRDTMGIPLLDRDRIQAIRAEQRRHLECIQDPPGVELYTETGRLTKGGISLPTYRCARGSTSLESFHLHLNRFIPGESANPWHFQAFLLEGLVRWNEDRAASAAQEGRPLLRTYSGPLQHSLDQLSQRVLGSSLVRDYTKPREYTGELIGIEYLYSQTGRVLQDVSLDPDVPDAGPPPTEEDDELAEGRHELEDLTLHVPGEFTAPRTDPRSGQPADAPAPEPSRPTDPPEPAPRSPGRSSPEPQQTAEDYRGPDDQPGYLAVVRLATALVGLRHEQALSEGRVDELIGLYEALSPFDRARVVYPPRYTDGAARGGRFMAAKPGRTSIPGVESLRRCLVGQTSGPASSPSTSRLVEAVCVQLCNLYPTGTRVQGGARGTRWDSALLRYRHIRELVLGHQRLMARAPVQLFELNARTLSLWFTRTQREKERAVLTPGVAADGGRPPAAAAATAPGPASAAAVDRPAAAATATSAVPQGRATTAAARGAVAPAAAPAVAAPVPALQAPVVHRRLLAPRPPAPSAAYPAFLPTAAAAAATGPLRAAQPLLVDLSLPRQCVWVLPVPPPLLTLPRTLPAPHVLPPPLAAAQHAGPELPVPLPAAQHAGPELPVALKTVEARRLSAKRRAEAPPGTTLSHRAGVPQVHKCSKCGQPRRRETGHSRYGGEVFCSVAAGQSVEDWLRGKKERDQGRAQR